MLGKKGSLWCYSIKKRACGCGITRFHYNPPMEAEKEVLSLVTYQMAVRSYHRKSNVDRKCLWEL